MGRLIPAGTGMEFYRNVRVERDTSAEREREEPVMESLSDILGGVETPTIPPPRERVAAVGDGDAEVEEEDQGDEE